MPERVYSGNIKDTTLREEVSDTLTFIGRARPGTSQALPAWQIMRFNVVGTLTSIEFANGSAEYSFVWNDRASFSYS